MNILQGIILGIVQGIAEFLPISSSGHSTVLQGIFGLDAPGNFFDVILHFATLIPVLIVYRSEILGLVKNPFQKMTYLLIVGTIPAVVITILFGDTVDKYLATGRLLPIFFIFTGITLIYADKVSNGSKSEPTYFDAFVVGCMQSIGILPGVSRSGSTIAGGLARGLDREAAAKFSFLLSIPAIMGALTLQIMKIATGKIEVEQIAVIPTIAGFIAALISGYFAINFLISIIKKAKLKFFANYVFCMAIFVLICQYILGIEFSSSLT